MWKNPLLKEKGDIEHEDQECSWNNKRKRHLNFLIKNNIVRELTENNCWTMWEDWKAIFPKQVFQYLVRNVFRTQWYTLVRQVVCTLNQIKLQNQFGSINIFLCVNNYSMDIIKRIGIIIYLLVTDS